MPEAPTLEVAILQSLRERAKEPASLALELNTSLSTVLSCLKRMKRSGYVRHVSTKDGLEGVARTYYITGHGSRYLDKFS
jgi:DNA-binding IclR family transcriptional regulator